MCIRDRYGSGGSLTDKKLTGVGTSPCSGGGWPCGEWNTAGNKPKTTPIGAFGDKINFALTNIGGGEQQTVTFGVTLKTPVPAPAALPLFAVGLLALALTSRRWRKG